LCNGRRWSYVIGRQSFRFLFSIADNGPYACGSVAEDIWLFVFVIEFFLRMGAQVVVDDGVEAGISDCGYKLFATGDALSFLFGDQLGETGPAEPVVAGLDGNREDHDMVAEWAGDLFLQRVEKFLILFILLLLLHHELTDKR
jgi:hypothetical protein